MDILRLALEQAKSAKEAVKIITSLIENYPQGGNAHFFDRFYYHNSFMVADYHESFVIETAGKLWVVKQVAENSSHSISNVASINHWDDSCKSLSNGSKFAEENNDFLISKLGCGRERQVYRLYTYL